MKIILHEQAVHSLSARTVHLNALPAILQTFQNVKYLVVNLQTYCRKNEYL